MSLNNYNRLFILTFLLVVIVAFCQSCANIGALNGGKKDITPPQIVLKKSTPNFQTQFKKQAIDLTFNEWIRLDDAFNQIIVSPPLNDRPEVILDGKTVHFTFAKGEILREKATYTINFGSAVKDLNEGNIAKDLRFVFATGNEIDSLTVRGTVLDALTNEPVEGALLMLYDNLSDSVVRKLKPFYFGKTDKQGNAIIQNVRAGTFKVFALMDKDQNYLFNQDIEKIGFPVSVLNVSIADNAPQKFIIDTSNIKDTLKTNNFKSPKRDFDTPLSIRLFEPIKKNILLSKETEKYGLLKLIFNQSPTAAKVSFDNIGQRFKTDIDKDTLLIFYDLDKEATWNLFVKNDTAATDTIRVRTRGRADFLKKNKLQLLNIQPTVALNITKNLILNFNNPLQLVDNQQVSLLDSAKKNIPLSIFRDSTHARTLKLQANWQEGQTYKLLFLPMSLTDIYGLKNDTIAMNVFIQNKQEFGDIVLNIQNLDSTKNYISQIITPTGEIETAFYIQKKSYFETRIQTVQPDQYTLKIIEDANENKRWDTGDYDTKQQPERIFLKKLEALRPNWELEANFDFKDIKN